MKTQIKAAEFLGSYSNTAGMPREGWPEMAVIGRSNVGKSTFVNRISMKKGLARTSQMPGRTQSLVCFKMTVFQPRSGDHNLILVDLPGYGFAKLSKGERERLQRLIVDYLRNREELKVICLLNDCRRDPEEEELAVRDIAAEAGKHLLVVLNKVDKLTRNEQARRIPELAAMFGLEKDDVICSGNGVPADNFWERVLPLL